MGKPWRCSCGHKKNYGWFCSGCGHQWQDGWRSMATSSASEVSVPRENGAKDGWQKPSQEVAQGRDERNKA
eukprot:3295404-Prorocentrum_lima.AAC.1